MISPFEYVTILISIILGLGITQVLSSFSDMFHKNGLSGLYGPHAIWILFILFLHVQDWFVTYQLIEKQSWKLPEVIFILLYPIVLFLIAKLLFPFDSYEQLKDYYLRSFPSVFYLMAFCVVISVIFNLSYLKQSFTDQFALIAFFCLLVTTSITKTQNNVWHWLLSFIVAIGTAVSVVLEHNVWIIK